MATQTAQRAHGRRTEKGLSGKGNALGKRFIDLLERQSLDAKLAAVVLDATQSTHTEMLYDDGEHELFDDLLGAWTRDVEAACERGELTDDQEYLLMTAKLLLECPA